MENTSDSFMPRPLLFCLKSGRSVCYSVPDNNRVLIDMRNEGLCEEHERKVVKMFIKSFKNSSIVSY